ncbi:hypothetical protein R3P38DRAFT_959564 [Favolaschia claudopus]|uniref:Uncharacterized protein n=1 Tax=Favolaschia claudopus TaxID=2862362 RepID=A0AAV9ZDU9_9AGAR
MHPTRTKDRVGRRAQGGAFHHIRRPQSLSAQGCLDFYASSLGRKACDNKGDKGSLDFYASRRNKSGWRSSYRQDRGNYKAGRRSIRHNDIETHIQPNLSHCRRPISLASTASPRLPSSRPLACHPRDPARELDVARELTLATVGGLQGPPQVSLAGLVAWAHGHPAFSRPSPPPPSSPTPIHPGGQGGWVRREVPNTAPTAGYVASLEELFGPGSVLRGEGSKPAGENNLRHLGKL